jgi:hypothetical protein
LVELRVPPEVGVAVSEKLRDGGEGQKSALVARTFSPLKKVISVVSG